jgi:hypothetical protein
MGYQVGQLVKKYFYLKGLSRELELGYMWYGWIKLN